MFKASCEVEMKIWIFRKNGFSADKNGTFLRLLSGLNQLFRVVYGGHDTKISSQKSRLEVEFLIFRNFQKVEKCYISHFFGIFFQKLKIFKLL